MRVFKLGIISLVFFSVFLTLFSLLFPSRIRISKAIDLSATETEIVNQLRTHHQWYVQADSIALFGKDGSIEPLQGKDTNAEPIMEYVMKGARFPDEKVRQAGWNFYITNAPGKLSVQWYMDFKLKWYPWEKFTGLLLEKRYGPALEKGLEKLKAALEK